MLAPRQDLIGLRSRRHIMPFELAQPRAVAEAHTAMAQDERAVFIAGGVDLIDWMKYGEPVDRLIALNGIAALKGIRREAGRVVIGALATHADVAGNTILAAAIPDLTAIWQTIANPRIRYAGTIGGNLMSGLPHYDAAPALLALKAKATLSWRDRSETVELDTLPAHAGFLLEAVSIEEAPRVVVLADRSLHPTLSLYLAARLNGAGELLGVRVAIGCAFPRPIVIDLPIPGPSLSASIDNAAEVARAVVSGLPLPADDGVASAAYRRRMIEVLIRRLLVRLGARA